MIDVVMKWAESVVFIKKSCRYSVSSVHVNKEQRIFVKCLERRERELLDNLFLVLDVFIFAALLQFISTQSSVVSTLPQSMHFSSMILGVWT